LKTLRELYEALGLGRDTQAQDLKAFDGAVAINATTRNVTEPVGCNAVASAFRTWRASLGPAAKPYVLHGLRKLAIVRLAGAGWTDAQIQAMKNQSAAMVAYYRQLGNRKRLTRVAHELNGT
jgi:hypothetical protein